MITKYLKSLVPQLEKNTILDDLDVSIKMLKDVLDKDIKAMKSGGVFSGKDKLVYKDKMLKKWNTMFKQANGKNSSGLDMVEVIFNSYPKIIKTAEALYDRIEKELPSSVLSDAIPADKLVLTRAAEHISFISTFTPFVLNVVSAIMVSDYSKSEKKDAKHGLPDISFKRMTKYIVGYGSILGIYSGDTKKIMKAIDDTPDVILSKQNADLTAASLGTNKLDRLDSGLATHFTYNPIYHVRVMITEYQVNRYNANKETRNTLMLRNEYLVQLQRTGESDPKIEREIAYNQNRINRLNKIIDEYEADLGDD